MFSTCAVHRQRCLFRLVTVVLEKNIHTTKIYTKMEDCPRINSDLNCTHINME